ncbi:MAG: DUF2961 domain-containing protein [bacterium]|nr:DUF2961 domain-containing protein [bacterium]
MLVDERLYTMVRGVETRWASPENPGGAKGGGGRANGGRKGSAYVRLKAGGRHVLAEVKGRSGVVRRIWLTLGKRTPVLLRSLRLQCYWDGAVRPAVDVPLGDFFGWVMGRSVAFESALFSSPEGRSCNCYVPMPFRRAMRMEVINESDEEVSGLFYDVDMTLGDALGAEMLYFHAWFHRENPTRLQKDYRILARVKGSGRFLGAMVGVAADTRRYGLTWWGEGECKIYLDGDRRWPTLCGTGTEDYIGTGWSQGRFDHLYQGCHLADQARMHYGFYRFHVPDPVYFEREIEVRMQQIGCWEPGWKEYLQRSGRVIRAGRGRRRVDLRAPETPEYGLFEREDDWSSCAYFYVDRAEVDLPELPSVGERTAGLLLTQP